MRLAWRQQQALWFGLLLIVLGVAVGWVLPLPLPSWQLRAHAADSGGLSDLWLIAGRNLQIGLRLLIGIVSLGIYSVLQLFSTGIALALTLKAGLGAGIAPGRILLLLAPHTVPEFAGFMLLGALEFEAARLAYHKIRYDQLPFNQVRLRALTKQALLGLVLIVLAAGVEVYFTLPLLKRLL